MDAVITVGEAAQLLGKCEQTVRAWADSGRLPCMRARSGLRLFRRADVEHVVRALAKPTTKGGRS